MHNYKIAIVGSGLSALGIINQISKYKKIKVLIIDSTNENIIKKDFKKPLFCDEKLPVPINNTVKITDKPFLYLQTIQKSGGNSNFWGGYSCRFDEDDFKKWPIKYDDFKKNYIEAERILNIKKQNLYNNLFLNNKSSNFNIFKSQIAEKNNKIFNSYEYIKKIINKNRYDLINLSLNKFAYNKKKFCLYFNNTKKIYFSDYLILCTGVINTEKIIKNSILKAKIHKIKQAQSFLVPAYININHNKNLNLQVFSTKKIKDFKFYFEIKKNFIHLKNVLKSKYKIVNFFPKKILCKIGIIWGFLPSNLSFDYQIIENKFLMNSSNEKKSKKIKKILKLFLKKFERESKIFIFNKLLKINQYGRSYHLGCNFPMKLYKNCPPPRYLTTNTYGKLKIKNINNLYIVGSSIFPNLPSKSFGLTLLANSLRIGKKIINDISYNK